MSKLALSGGNRVRTKPFSAWPQFDHREATAINEVLTSRNWGGYPFPNRLTKLFDQKFAAFHGARFCVSAANGTVTIEAALKAFGIGPGDEVILPAYTFEATAVPILRLQAIPVFVDVLPDTYCIDPAAAEAAITPRTKAIIPVHLAMNMADMDALGELARHHGLKILEDAAHAHGARWRDCGAGSCGDAGSFSMQTSKLMTAGEGGAITVNDEEIYERCQSYINCGRASENDKYGHRLLGYNYRMTEFQAAILLVQLERLAEQTALREQRACRLSAQLAQIPGLCLLRKDERQTTQAIYHYVFKYNPEGFRGLDRNRFLAALQAEGIPCDGVFYEPVYRSSLFKVDTRDFPLLPDTPPWQDTRCPVAEKAAYKESIWLNHNLLLGDEKDIDDVVEAIAKVQKYAHEILDIEHHLVVLQRLNRADRDGYLKSIAAKAEPPKEAPVTPGS